ncbi:MAG: hypothetical protein EBS19_02260 [Spirochaetia bacterium]|nr:hypothetical protein [Spirochaetia bacterium]
MESLEMKSIVCGIILVISLSILGFFTIFPESYKDYLNYKTYENVIKCRSSIRDTASHINSVCGPLPTLRSEKQK